jgi:hypothetical protein
VRRRLRPALALLPTGAAWPRRRDALQAIDRFALRDAVYEPLAPGPDGIVRSRVYPGLWLDREALLGRDLQRVLAVLAQGLASAEHGAFVEELRAAEHRGARTSGG